MVSKWKIKAKKVQCKKNCGQVGLFGRRDFACVLRTSWEFFFQLYRTCTAPCVILACLGCKDTHSIPSPRLWVYFSAQSHSSLPPHYHCCAPPTPQTYPVPTHFYLNFLHPPFHPSLGHKKKKNAMFTEFNNSSLMNQTTLPQILFRISTKLSIQVFIYCSVLFIDNPWFSRNHCSLKMFKTSVSLSPPFGLAMQIRGCSSSTRYFFYIQRLLKRAHPDIPCKCNRGVRGKLIQTPSLW